MSTWTGSRPLGIHCTAIGCRLPLMTFNCGRAFASLNGARVIKKQASRYDTAGKMLRYC